MDIQTKNAIAVVQKSRSHSVDQQREAITTEGTFLRLRQSEVLGNNLLWMRQGKLGEQQRQREM